MRELIRRLRIYTSPAPKDVLEASPRPSFKPAFEVVEAIDAAPVGSGHAVQAAQRPESATQPEPSESSDMHEGHSPSWAGQPEPGRVPCCVNAFTLPSFCTIL